VFISLLLAILLFAACGNGENENNNENNVNENNANEEVEENNTAANEEEEEEDYRIVATTVALVEVMEELDLDLVGVPTSYKELPARYDDAEEVGLAAEPDLEIIRSLQATDVLSATTLDTEYDLAPVFENANIPVSFIDLESVEGMYNSIKELGEKYNRKEQAEEIIQDFHDQVARVEERIEGEESPTVLILLGVPGSYLVATENSYIGDLVARAGGKNAIQGVDLEYVASNTENLQQSDPDIILRAAHGMPDQVVEMFDKEFEENDIWKHFKAVEDGRVYDLEETLFGTTANLAVPEALEELVKMLYDK